MKYCFYFKHALLRPNHSNWKLKVFRTIKILCLSQKIAFYRFQIDKIAIA